MCCIGRILSRFFECVYITVSASVLSFLPLSRHQISTHPLVVLCVANKISAQGYIIRFPNFQISKFFRPGRETDSWFLRSSPLQSLRGHRSVCFALRKNSDLFLLSCVVVSILCALLN